MALKIKKITIENFRGIRQPLVIDFNKGGQYTSASIYGRNGTGKSSILNAWEWLLNFDIVSLKKEGVSAKDYPHKASGGNNSYIQVEFAHSTINSTKVEFNNSKTTAPTISGEHQLFKTYCKYPNYLRYIDLQDFVYKTKNEKYKYIAKYFGLEKYTSVQSQLLTSIKKLTTDLSSLREELEKNKNTLESVTGSDDISETEIVKYFNVLASRHSLTTITNFSDSKSVRSELKKLVERNPKIKELTEWNAFQIKLNNFFPITSLKTDLQELETKFVELRKEEENLTKLILSDLYNVSLEVIPKLENSNICPLCDKSFEGNLLEHINFKHLALSELRTKKSNYDIQSAQIINKLDSINQKCLALNTESSTTVLKIYKDLFSTVNLTIESVPNAKDILSKSFLEISDLNISEDEFVSDLEELILKGEELQLTVNEKIKSLEDDEGNKRLAEDYHNSHTLLITYFEHIISEEKVNYLSNKLINLEKLYEKLTQYIQNSIQSTFNIISADVLACYNILEGSNPFLKNPELKLVTGRDKAVELEIEFVSEKVTPAYKFMSESQVNSFGLSIFLAAVKHFNNDFKFFILDDVVNSFDNYKRPKVSQLLATHFNDFQVLVLTHDDIFFNTVQRAFPNWNRYKFVSWDFTNGPRYKIARSYFEEIQEDLDDDNPVKAGQTLGRYLEWTLGTLCENLQTPIPYRIENIYTLSDFFGPLKARIEKFLKRGGAGVSHKLVNLISDFDQNSFFRNFCVHWKNETSTFSKEEIQAIFDKWKEIEEEIFCSNCKSYVKLDRPSGQEYLKCNCGTIDLKDSRHYI
ncbi:hypothetical protein JAO76_13650 [Pontibacter sp. BT310]|uniref:RecF/RecN/SMC N-terminal domain-containing protein n=1 Tax=Pontibacter populi TaxID=890055 RepID=A0ABS6XDN0_9BACT|nr:MULTISPECIES: hypothetical protein [Pontibacter]MBJ6119249.1 hypothetical protein [Pontibacter sp. BT310]MBR0571677.1 hypothetical protein [Microvirga sp. STS03]MBW3366103.1 hypothetical protein [Pontibacter populi]